MNWIRKLLRKKKKKQNEDLLWETEVDRTARRIAKAHKQHTEKARVIGMIGGKSFGINMFNYHFNDQVVSKRSNIAKALKLKPGDKIDVIFRKRGK